MQKCVLTRHSDTPCDAIEGIEVELSYQTSGALRAQFHLRGDVGRVSLPPSRASQREDELWRHTCCEVFVRPTEAVEYFEFNFSPSTAWAAYRFTGYREGMTNAEVSVPQILLNRTVDTVELIAMFTVPESIASFVKARLGLSCVIEELNGRISYWALAHPQGKPDFHHASGFALELKA
jgi:hypothetical protein